MSDTYKAELFNGPLAGTSQEIPREGTFGNDVVQTIEIFDSLTHKTYTYEYNGTSEMEYFPLRIPPQLLLSASYNFVGELEDPDFYISPPYENF